MRTKSERFGALESSLYIRAMRKEECQWEVIRLRARGEYLGIVSTVDEEGALKAAAKAFEIRTVAQQKQLLVRRA